MSIVGVFHKLGIDEGDIVIVASVIKSLERELGNGYAREIKEFADKVENLVRSWDELVISLGGKKEVEKLFKERGLLDQYEGHREWGKTGYNLPG